MENKNKKGRFDKEREIIRNLNQRVGALIELVNTCRQKETLLYGFIIELAKCKELYEKIFPLTKRGGHIFKLHKLNSRTKIGDNSITPLGGFIVEKRAIITPSGVMVDKNLILPTKGIVNKDETIRSFVELMVNKTELGKTVLRNRLRVARFILEGKIAGKDVELYKENKVKFSHILEKIKSIKRKKKFLF
jgi:hypothetical protein